MKKYLRQFPVTLVAIGLLAGCRGIQTESERVARKHADAVAHEFRPGGHGPSRDMLTTNSTLGGYVHFAMLNQPKVAAAYFDWLASIETITTARSLPDPQITFQMDIQNIVSSIMPGVMMNFPGPGKLRVGALAASAQSDIRFYDFRSASLETAYDVRRAYYELFFLDEKLHLLQNTLGLLSDLEKLARAQNEVGKVTLQDILRAQIEQERLRTEVTNLEDSRVSLVARFKQTLGLKPTETIPPLSPNFQTVALDPDGANFVDQIVANSVRLKSLSAQIRAADALIAAAYKSKVPDFSAGVMADVKMSPVLYRPVGTITLPIWRDKIAAQIAQAKATKQSAQARLDAADLELSVAVAEKAFLFREASRNLRLYENELLPMQRESLEVARSGYISGQIDFFNLTDAEQTLLRFGLAAVDARAQRELVLTELSLISAGMPPSATGTSSATEMPNSSTRPAAQAMKGMQ